MAKTLQFRRGTTAVLASQTGSVGELFVDTSKTTVVVMDGATAGGTPLAKEADVFGAKTVSTKQTFAGSTTSLAVEFTNVVENVTVTSTAATGIIQFDVTTQNILYSTAAAAASWVLNFRASATTSLNSVMNTGESLSAVFMATQNATAYFNTSITIDGTAVTPRWQGGSAPSAGNTSSIDVYAYTIIKTASSTYTVLASQTQYK